MPQFRRPSISFLAAGLMLALTVNTAVNGIITASASPPITLLITGNLKGALRECHCPDGQPGGLARRKTLIDSLRVKYPEALLVECGPLQHPGKVMSDGEIKLMIELFSKLKYSAIITTDADQVRLSRYPDIRNFPNFITGIKGDKDDSGYKIFKTNNKERGGFSTVIIPASNSLDSGAAVKADLIIYAIPSVKNYLTSDATSEEDAAQYPKLPDVLLVAGGDWAEPYVFERNGQLLIYPGQYGGWVTEIHIWKGSDGRISKFEWITHPTRGAIPNSLFQKILSSEHIGR